MTKFFMDTEFIEGFRETCIRFPFKWRQEHFINLISIGMVCEDGRDYYAISNEYNYNDADQWVKDNVILPMYIQTVSGDNRNRYTVENFHKYYGISNEQIAEEIKDFVSCKGVFFQDVNMMAYNSFESRMDIIHRKGGVSFIGYYADYDWVLFASLFGRMIDLPHRFPMYCVDLKQSLDEKVNNYSNADARRSELDSKYVMELYNMPVSERLDWVKKNIPQYPKQTNEHNALADAKWNYDLYKFLNSL